MNQPFLDLHCAPCGVWWAGAEMVLHQRPDGSTTVCRLPPRDENHLSARQQAAVAAAIRDELAKRAQAVAA